MEIVILFIISNVMLIYKIYELSNKLTITQSNYRNCLLALAEYDKDLKKYLEEENK